MDIPTLANATWQAIQPLLPLLAVKGAEEIGKQAGGALWEAVKAKFEQKPSAQEALTDLLETPNDEDMQAVFRVQLKKLLKNDADFVNQLEKLLESAGTSYSAINTGDGAVVQGNNSVGVGKGGIYIGGSASGSTIVTGDGVIKN